MSEFTGRTTETPGEPFEGGVVHATCVRQSDSYHYDEVTACRRYCTPEWSFWPAAKDAKVTCLNCLAVLES